jgi:hypothetical protein
LVPRLVEGVAKLLTSDASIPKTFCDGVRGIEDFEERFEIGMRSEWSGEGPATFFFAAGALFLWLCKPEESQLAFVGDGDRDTTRDCKKGSVFAEAGCFSGGKGSCGGKGTEVASECKHIHRASFCDTRFFRFLSSAAHRAMAAIPSANPLSIFISTSIPIPYTATLLPSTLSKCVAGVITMPKEPRRQSSLLHKVSFSTKGLSSSRAGVDIVGKKVASHCQSQHNRRRSSRV